MGPKSPPAASDHDLFRLELITVIDRRHELVRLAELIDWSLFDREFGAQFASTTDRPALPHVLRSLSARGSAHCCDNDIPGCRARICSARA